MSKQKALKKIAKCLELGNSANVNEAANAIKMAHRLMLKYGLDKDDIEFIKLGKTLSSHLLPANVSSTLLRVIRGINTKFGVEAVLLNHKGLKKAEFIGEAIAPSLRLSHSISFIESSTNKRGNFVIALLAVARLH